MLALSACAANDAPRFREAEQLAPGGDVGTAPMFAVSRDAAEAAAWISAPGGGSDGRLNVRVGDGRVVELRDSLGPIEPHGESPPKLAWSPDGALNALYVVARLVPGRRFPASALRFVRSTDKGTTWSAARHRHRRLGVRLAQLPRAVRRARRRAVRLVARRPHRASPPCS